MKMVIISGMSGAGKSMAIDAFEDMDYYCVDNMPLDFLIKFVEICRTSQNKMSKVAVVADIRSGTDFKKYVEDIDTIISMGIDLKIVVADASNDTIIKRYKETRRRHPLEKEFGGTMDSLIEKERAMLAPIFDRADTVIDTTYFTPNQFKEQLRNIFLGTEIEVKVKVTSFGFKHGIPPESDFVFDTRCLPNPFYDISLRNKTGLDAEVRDYVMAYQNSKKYLEKIADMVTYLIPMFKEEGRTSVNVAIGCTGGHHRSVTITYLLAELLESKNIKVKIYHRDIEK